MVGNSLENMLIRFVVVVLDEFELHRSLPRSINDVAQWAKKSAKAKSEEYSARPSKSSVVKVCSSYLVGMHGSMLVDILLYSPFTNCFEIAHATHDPVLGLYYMDAIIFREFISKYGNPGIKVAAHNCGYSDCFAMKEESFLYAYGYSVAQSAGLSEYSRQELLTEVMDLGYMSAHGVLSLLNHNINMHPGVEYGNARDCWEADKRFVMNYNVNPQRFVVSTLGITPKTK